MFELITKGKLLRILKELCENNRAEKATGKCAFFYCCGVANAINYICHKLKLDYHA